MYPFKHILRGSPRVLRLGLGIMAALVLSGCATMSESECLTADWYDQGYRDGRRGYPASRVIDHREACSGVGVMPDLKQYSTGRDRGITEYCTPANAVAEGRAGRSYGHVCPAKLEGRFLSYYRQGQLAYRAQQEVDRLNSQSRALQRELDKEKNADTRRSLRNQLRDLDHRLERARDDLADYDRNLPYR